MGVLVIYRIGVSSPITPTEPLPPLPEIPRGSLVIVEGRALIWRQAWLNKALPLRPSPIFDPRLGAVVVASHNQQWTVGQVVDVTLRAEKQSDLIHSVGST